jgi:hypothetical protein
MPAMWVQSSSDANSSQKQQGDFEIAKGTVLPVRLNHGFSSKNVKAGQAIGARIMQDVPLPNGDKISAGSKVLGSIVSVEPAANSGAGKISFRFDRIQIHHRASLIVTNLRAIAGFVEVQFAETPETSPGFGTPYPWVTTRQIGGDEVYGVGGPVTNAAGQHVGKGVFGGVLVHVRGGEGTKCRGSVDPQDRLQALWVFSADACGAYGMEGVTILYSGRTDPIGEITLTSDRRDVLVRGGTGMLLRVD